MAENNISIKSINKINDYLEALCHLNLKDFFIIISVKDTPGACFNSNMKNAFNSLGLQENLVGKKQCGYIAVINNGYVVYEILGEEQTGIKCNFEIDSFSLDIHSMPGLAGNRASIVIGTAQCAVNKRGLNIVVFNKADQCVIDSVCFDTQVASCQITRKDSSSIRRELFRYKVNMIMTGYEGKNITTSFSGLKNYIEENESRNDIKYWRLFKKERETENQARKRFFRGLECRNPEIKLIQDCISVLFYHFDRICKKNKIPYWMVCGSLIGAVRHGKCIPWDDDIDVYMERKDMERLKNVLEANEDFSLNIYYGSIGQAYIRYVRFMFKKIAVPCFVDVFFTDRVENSSDETWKELTSLRSELVGETSALEAKLAADNKLNRNEEIAKLLDGQVAKQQEILNPSGNGTALLWSVDQWQFWCKNVFDYDWVFPTRRVPFAYGACDIPACAEKMLAVWYGDIYELPKNINSHRHITLNNKQKEDVKQAIAIYAPKTKNNL